MISILETVGSLDKHTFSIQLESSNYPTLNSNINGEIQTSESYLETKIKTKIGSNAFNFEQLFSSQATLQKQELLFKIYFGIPDRNLAYGIDFEHRLASSDFTNRLELKWNDWIDFNAYLTNKKDANHAQKFRAGLKYSEIDLKAGVDLANQDNEIKGNLFLEWGSSPNQAIKTQFDLVMGSGTNYNVRTTINLPHFEEIRAIGQCFLT